MVIFGRRPIDINPLAVRPLTATIDSSKDDSRERALLFNVGELSRSIQQLQISTISYINFAGLISVGAITIGLVQPQRLVEIFAPYALTIVFTFLLQLYTDIERLITLREVFEAHLNTYLDAPAFLGLNDLSKEYRGRGSVRLVAGLLALPLLFFGFHSLKTTAGPQSEWTKYLDCFKDFDVKNLDAPCINVLVLACNVLGLAFCGWVLIRAAIEMRRAHDRAIQEAEQILGQLPQTSGSTSP